jgi:hypothetical protein
MLSRVRRAFFPFHRRVGGVAEAAYLLVSGVAGLATFVACMSYTVSKYGWLFGIGIGWIPSLFIAAIASYLWPLVAVAALVLYLRAG